VCVSTAEGQTAHYLVQWERRENSFGVISHRTQYTHTHTNALLFALSRTNLTCSLHVFSFLCLTSVNLILQSVKEIVDTHSRTMHTQ